MPRNHYYLIASVPPTLGATMLADAQALVDETNSAKTFIAAPEVTLTNDPDDSTRFRASVHFHVLQAERPNQVKRAIVDLFAAWKEAGAQLDEAGADDENVFDERPELKRRRQGEAAPKAVSVQLAEAQADLQLLTSQVDSAQAAVAAASVLVDAQKSRAEAAEMSVRSLRDQRDAADAAYREELAGYVAFVEAYRATRISPDDPVAAAALEVAYEPFATPEG